MSGRVKTIVIGVLAGALAAAAAPAAGSPDDSPPAAVTTAYQTVPLAHYAVTSTSCGLIPGSNGQRFPGCVHADGGARKRLRLDERVKAAFRGTVTLLLPEVVESVWVGYGRRGGTEHQTPIVVSTLPGSGTYDMVVTVKWHDEFTRSETTYLVPLWVPRFERQSPALVQ